MSRTSSRRRELISVAADLFAARGFANVTVDDIGDAAGVSGPALYHHFAGKEALLGEMLVDISQFLLDGGRRVLAQHGDDALDHLVRFHAEFAVSNRALITIHFRDLVHAVERDRAKVRRLQSQYALLWSEQIERRWGADRRTAQSAVHATFGLINSTPFSARLPANQMVQLLVTMANSALAAAWRDDSVT